MSANPIDVHFKQCSSKDSTEDERRAENDLLYTQLLDSNTKVKLIKQRDGYACFSAVANHEKELDEILHMHCNKRSDPSIVNDIYLVSPSLKTLNIRKMLHNVVYIRETGGPTQWSGHNVDYVQQLQFVDVRKFFNYLWCDQLLNSTGFGDKVCRVKLEKYVKSVLSNLNCLSCTDESMLGNAIEHVKSRYVNELGTIIDGSLNAFVSSFDMNEVFKLFIEWKIILGAVPVRKVMQTDNETLNRIKQTKSCFSTATFQRLLTIQNMIPLISDVAVILCENEIECWHLPSKEKLQLLGRCNLRVENKEICLGTEGETLYYAELRVMHLNEKHYEYLSLQRYVLTEVSKDEFQKANEKNKNEGKSEVEQSPLFATVTKSQTALFDENNPLSKFSRIRDRNENIKQYLSRVSTEMDELQDKMNSFLYQISPTNSNSVVDEMVHMGMETYLKNIKPKMEEWERTIRDHLNKFRMHAVKQLATLPKGMYEFQEQAAELNANNEMDIEEFIDEMSSTNVSKGIRVPNISHLQDIDKSEMNLKQMQEKVSQYFDLATSFMGYLRDAQKVISKLRVDDSLKELQVKALTEQKREIVKLATKYREISNKRIDTYRDQLKSVKSELDKYVDFQTQTAEKTKQHFLNIRDTMLTHEGEWIDKFRDKRDKQTERLKLLEENFAKRFDSTTNQLDRCEELEPQIIKVDGRVRKDNLDKRIDDNTLLMYRDMLKQLWKGVLRNTVCIQETVTRNGIQLYNVDEEQVLQKHVLTFFKLIYDRVFFVNCRNLDECARVYGIYIAIEVAVKKMAKLPVEQTTTTVVKQKSLDGSRDENTDTGLLLSN